MKIVALDGSAWAAPLDFYDALLRGLGAPKWHGLNINALVDSMIYHDEINKIAPPFRVTITGLSSASAKAQEELRDAIDALVSHGARCRIGSDGTATVEIVYPLSTGSLQQPHSRP